MAKVKAISKTLFFLREFSHSDNLLNSFSRGIFLLPLILVFNCISTFASGINEVCSSLFIRSEKLFKRGAPYEDFNH